MLHKINEETYINIDDIEAIMREPNIYHSLQEDSPSEIIYIHMHTGLKISISNEELEVLLSTINLI